jgi:hypothetical protein
MNLSKSDKEKLLDIQKLLKQNFKITITPEFKQQLSIIEKDPAHTSLEFQVKAAITKLAHDPKYKGLNSHKFSSLNEKYNCEVWESYIQNNTPGAWRLFWRYGEGKNEITLLLVTPHP